MPHPRRSPQELGFPTRAISAAQTTVSSILPLATDTSSLVTSTSTNAASSSVVAPTSSASSSSAPVPTLTKSASFYRLLSSYPGEITGITVGAAVLGSLLTAIMFWLWMGRSFRRRGSHSSIDDFLMLQPRETPSAPAKDTIPTLDDSLPKGTDDKTIVESMRNINGLIETYVEEYVTMTAIPGLDERDVSKIKEKVEKALTVYIDQSSQMPVNELSELLVDAQSRKSAVRYLIGWMLFSSITNYGDPRRTLLPTELIIFMNSIPPPTADRQFFQAALGKWRTISTFLLFPQNAPSQNPRREKEIRINIQRITICLKHTLQPLYNPKRTMQSRDESLEELVRKTAEFGLELFSQPTSWSVQWKDSDAQLGPLDEDERLGVLGQMGSHHRNFVVFPGLEKIAVDHATGTFQRTPVKVLGAEIDRNIEIGSSYRVSSIQIGLAS